MKPEDMKLTIDFDASPASHFYASRDQFMYTQMLNGIETTLASGKFEDYKEIVIAFATCTKKALIDLHGEMNCLKDNLLNVDKVAVILFYPKRKDGEVVIGGTVTMIANRKRLQRYLGFWKDLKRIVDFPIVFDPIEITDISFAKGKKST